MNFSDEDAWQAYLDANPEDHFARQAFADWLDDRGDPRAAGYRALGRLRRVPWYWSGSKTWGYFGVRSFGKDYLSRHGHERLSRGMLPPQWLRKLKYNPGKGGGYRSYSSRQEAEDAAALAWGRLPPERQVEILARVGVVEVGVETGVVEVG